jgi:hypothetical protein
MVQDRCNAQRRTTPAEERRLQISRKPFKLGCPFLPTIA